MTCDKGFISSTDKWRVQLEPISGMDSTVKVRYLGMDHIWECKEFLKRFGMHVNEDVAKDLD